MAFDKKITSAFNKLQPNPNPSTCSGYIVATAGTPIVAGSGTGSVRGHQRRVRPDAFDRAGRAKVRERQARGPVQHERNMEDTSRRDPPKESQTWVFAPKGCLAGTAESPASYRKRNADDDEPRPDPTHLTGLFPLRRTSGRTAFAPPNRTVVAVTRAPMMITVQRPSPPSFVHPGQRPVAALRGTRAGRSPLSFR